MQIIKNWLEGAQHFRVGVTIYSTIGSNQLVKDLLARGETPFARKLLKEEFEKMLLPVEPVKPVSIAANNGDEKEVMPDSFDEVLQALKLKWTAPYQRMNYLRHQLDKQFDDNDSIEAINYRKSIVFGILDLEQECIQIWTQRNYYVKNGKLPNVPETKITIPTDPVELAGLINNIKKNIRRNRKSMQDHPDQPHYAQLYADYKAKYKEITGRDYEEKD